MDLGDAVRLFAGKGGERWLVQARSGTSEAAPQLGAEDLVAITRPDSDTYAFLGAKGSIYVARTPLGPFETVRRINPAPMRVAAAGQRIVALHWDGRVSYSADAGRTFSSVELEGARPFDFALSPDGRALMLGYPERLWVSRDAAATWTAANVPTIGAGFVGLDANGSLIARGLRSSVVWGNEPDQQPQVASRALEEPPLDLWTDLEPGPSAQALARGHAAIVDDAYFEVARRDDEGPWYLGRSELVGRIRWVPLPDSEDCHHMVMGASGRFIALGCLSGARRGGVLFPFLRLMLSRDGGSTFSPKRRTSLVADEEGIAISVLDDGTLLVVGACTPDPEGICTPSAPIRIVPVTGGRTVQFASIEAAEVPAIAGRTGPVRVSNDRDRVYAAGRLSPGLRPAVLVSDDRGESFRAVPLDLSKTAPAQEVDANDIVHRMQPGQLRVSEDGTLSWVLHADVGPVWIVIDAAGRVQSAHIVPEEYPYLQAVGRRGIVFGGQDGIMAESHDGGESFTSLNRLPLRVASDEAPEVWCASSGCVFGEEFSRTGWGDASGGVIDEPKTDGKEGGDEPKDQPGTATRTPIVCEINESEAGKLDNVTDFPSASDAFRGNTAWSALLVDRKTGAVQVARATANPKHQVRAATLFPPARQPGRIALDARSQAEGAVALRYTFAKGSDGQPLVGKPIGRVEVAWDNQFEGPPKRAFIPRAGPLRSGDVTVGSAGSVASANAGMLSVAPGGVHVCPHHRCDRPGDRALFVRKRGRTDRIAMPPWPKRALRGGSLPISPTIMHVHGKHVPIALHRHWSVVMRAVRDESGGYTFPALALAPWDAKEVGLREARYWSHLGSKMVGLSHTVFHPDHPLAYAEVLRFDVDEGVARVVPAPTQRDLSDPPAACSEQQRESTFRVIGPSIGSARHPVIIDLGRLQEVLYTDLSVLHGTPSSPCSVVFDARSSESRHRRALIPIGAMDRSWLLSRSSSTLQWYGMRCRFQPGAEVPGKSSSPPPPSEPSASSTGSMQPATDADCSAVFDKLIGLMGSGNPPAGTLGPARKAFQDTCRGKPIDMECVRRAANAAEIMKSCLRL